MRCLWSVGRREAIRLGLAITDHAWVQQKVCGKIVEIHLREIRWVVGEKKQFGSRVVVSTQVCAWRARHQPAYLEAFPGSVSRREV